MKRILILFLIILSFFLFIEVKAEDSKDYVIDFSYAETIYDFNVFESTLIEERALFDVELSESKTIFERKSDGKPIFSLKDYVGIELYLNQYYRYLDNLDNFIETNMPVWDCDVH